MESPWRKFQAATRANRATYHLSERRTRGRRQQFAKRVKPLCTQGRVQYSQRPRGWLSRPGIASRAYRTPRSMLAKPRSIDAPLYRGACPHPQYWIVARRRTSRTRSGSPRKTRVPRRTAGTPSPSNLLFVPKPSDVTSHNFTTAEVASPLVLRAPSTSPADRVNGIALIGTHPAGIAM